MTRPSSPNDTNPTWVFGNSLDNQTATPTIGRTGQGLPPVCLVRPVISPTTQAATTAFTVTQGTWDDTSETVKYSYGYEWYEGSTAGEDFKEMAASALSTPKTSSASTAATKIMCLVTAINRTTGAVTVVAANQATAT